VNVSVILREIHDRTTSTDVVDCPIVIWFEIIVDDLCVLETRLGLGITEEALAFFVVFIFLKQIMSA
jgi:hypothetical protein